MPLNSRLNHRPWWLAISILMPRVLFVPAQLSTLVCEAQSSCPPHIQRPRAGCSRVPDPSTGLSCPALSKLAEGLYTVTFMLPITIPSLSRSPFPDDQKPARPHALTVLTLGPKQRARRNYTLAQPVQIGIERVGFWWCNLMHNAPMWPIHGQYECRTCGRHHNVPWNSRDSVMRFGKRDNHRTNQSEGAPEGDLQVIKHERHQLAYNADVQPIG